jgi:hypothetical protein
VGLIDEKIKGRKSRETVSLSRFKQPYEIMHFDRRFAISCFQSRINLDDCPAFSIPFCAKISVAFEKYSFIAWPHLPAYIYRWINFVNCI